MNRPAAGDRRGQLVAVLAGVLPGCASAQLTAAVDASLSTPGAVAVAYRTLAADARLLWVGAPPAVGRLAVALAAGGAPVPVPTCRRCGRAGFPLILTDGVGVCERCRRRQLACACSRCGVRKPVAARDGSGAPCCARCADRPRRRCGRCGRVRVIARRARDGQPDICDGCFRPPVALCSRCGERRPCNFAGGAAPLCLRCSPRRSRVCAHCGQPRPPAVNWPEGPVCDPCYTAALRRRGRCTRCGVTRRLVAPAGPAANVCAECAGVEVRYACVECGREDKLYLRGRCARCALAGRVHRLLSGPDGTVPAALISVEAAIAAHPVPRSALNWLRAGAGARILADLAAGRLPLSHQALDDDPRRAAADYLRVMLVAHAALPARDDAVARVETRLAGILAGIDDLPARQLVAAYASWRVLRRLRRRAERAGRPRTVTAHAEHSIRAAAGLLRWLAGRDRTLGELTQADVDDWLRRGDAASHARDFLTWAGEHGHCPPVTVPPPRRTTTQPVDAEGRWRALTRLLHDDDLALTDRVAGALLLCYAQPLSRIVALTRDDLEVDDPNVRIRFGGSPITAPPPLSSLLTRLLTEGRSHVGVGTPGDSPWLFPGGQPGRPLTAAHLGARLRRCGVYAIAGRRAALTQLAAELPAAVLADLLHLQPTTAVRWVAEAGGDWSRYAAELVADPRHRTPGNTRSHPA